MPEGKKYQRIYLTTFALIALLITTSLIIIDYIAAEESLMVEVHDIGGRQRMLSERTVHLLLEYAAEKEPGARDQIVKLIELSLQQFDKTHKRLIRGRLSAGDTVIFLDSIDDIFFGEAEYLDEKARIFIYNIREVLAKEWSPDLISSYYLKQLREATKQVLHNGLDTLAIEYTRYGKSRIMRLRIIVAILLGGIVVVLCGVGVFVFNPMFKRIETQEQELHNMAFIDPLADCHNRRSFLTSAEIAFERSRRYNHTFAILYLDIDRFKDLNDNYGHAIGDDAIKELTRICQDNIRDSDILGRIGGDEFGIILQECGLDFAVQTAEKLRQRISDHIISCDAGTIQFSISVGAATIMGSDKDIDDILKRADKYLYKAKRTGRNLVIAA